jgi:DNA polymerase III delta prime subunit
MFENIIGQAGPVETLRRELSAGRLPAALLLSGPRYSGKLSAALEIARVLTCGQRGEWSCACPSCRRQRLLLHPATLLAGWRYFEADIAAAADCLRRVGNAPARYLFLRAVRKLTRRFDPPLWEGEESRLKPASGALVQVEEALDALSPEEAAAETPVPEKVLESVLAGCRQLARVLPPQNIPLGLLRRAVSWLHLTAPGPGSRRVLILEAVEGLLETSSNSLLKTLEEPPGDAYLILTTSRRAALAPTVLSRLRTYAFSERGPAETAEVLSRIFRETDRQYASLRDYFLAWQEVDPRELETLARRFANVASGQEAEQEVLDRLKELFGDRKAGDAPGRERASIFYQELLVRFRGLLGELGAVEPRRLARWNALLRGHLEALERYNQSPLLNLESLLLGLRSAN